jgi:hypothetical protein
MAFILGSPPGVTGISATPYSAFQQSPVGPDTPEPCTSAGAILVGGMGLEGEPSRLFYAGTAGLEWTFFLTDRCPICQNVHRSWAAPVPNANGQLVLSFPCFAGPSGASVPPPIVSFTFAGWGMAPTGDVMNAIASGALVGN